MRLARIGDPGHEVPAVELDDGLVELGELASTWRASPTNPQIEDLATAIGAGALEGQPRISEPSVRYGPPVTPSKIVCIGLNFADHAAEGGMEPPDEPVVFMKAPNCIVGPNDDVVIPPGSNATDYEVELAVVLGERVSYLESPETARAAIAGFTISNDVSERHWQLERGGSWDKGKCFPTFNPLGPWLVTPDEIADVQALDMRLQVNGETRQDSSTKQMIFSVEHLVWYVSQFMTLEPGDVINTGTPAGVGLGFQPPRYLSDGDRLELEIEGLGRQSQHLVGHSRSVQHGHS